MKRRQIHETSRRERQVLEIIYRRGHATAAEVLEMLPDDPSYSAVRGILRVLEERGLLRHRQEGPRYVYFPTVPRSQAMRSAMRNVLRTFFDGSAEGAVAALLEMEAGRLTGEQLDRMVEMIAQARKEGR